MVKYFIVHVNRFFRQPIYSMKVTIYIVLVCALLTPGHGMCFMLQGRVHEYRLENGMTLLCVQRIKAPVVACALSFAAGAVDEPSGATGAAHMLEHMLFKGTTTIGTRDYAAEKPLLDRIRAIGKRLDELSQKGRTEDRDEQERLRRELGRLQEEHNRLIVMNEIDALYSRNGAEGMNAGTGFDLTTYTVSLPANRIELWARIESDRFKNPVFRQYYTERDVVLEELRQSYASRPDRLLTTNLLAAAFQAHPYGRPIIGWPSDIQTLPLDACETFFHTHYTADKAVAAVVGDIQPEALFSLVKRYFSDLSAGVLTSAHITTEPEQQGERRFFVEANAEPLLLVGYHKPTLPLDDDTVCDVISTVLSSGRSSRLYKRLVIEKRVAATVDTSNGFPGARYPNLFLITIAPAHGVSYADVEHELYRELDRLSHAGISPAELLRAQKQMRADLLRSMQSNEELSRLLAYYQSIAGDWRYLERKFERIGSVTVQDIQTVAGKYFRQSNRVVGMLVRERKHEP